MSHPSAKAASSAIGAMFFTVFGCCWLVWWCLKTLGASWVVLGPILISATLLLLAALRQFRLNKVAYKAEAGSIENKKIGRLFNIVNAAQWIAMILVGNVLSNIGRSEWFIPAVICIVGLHFLPLALLFKAPRHYVTGVAMIAFAVLYPILSPNGPAEPIGCLGAGLILWASSAYVLLPRRFFMVNYSGQPE